MACRGSTDERSMRYLRFRIIADRAEASHACSRRTGFFGKEKTERLTRCPPLRRPGLQSSAAAHAVSDGSCNAGCPGRV